MENQKTETPVYFHLHNTTRGRGNRTLRAQAPAHLRFKQYVTGTQLRLIRGRPLLISAELVRANLPELQQKNKQGILELRTMDGRLVDLTTLEAPAFFGSPPLPNFPLDDANRDKPAGENLPRFAGENVLVNDQRPALLQEAPEDIVDPLQASDSEESEEEVMETAPPVMDQIPLDSASLSDEDLERATAPSRKPDLGKKGKRLCAFVTSAINRRPISKLAVWSMQRSLLAVTSSLLEK